MRMVFHRARPGVEHREDAGGAADPRAIVGQRLDGGCGFAEQRGVDHHLVCASDGAQRRGEGEGEEAVIARESSGPNALEPVLRPLLLTLGTVPVAARVVAIVQRAAVITLIE